MLTFKAFTLELFLRRPRFWKYAYCSSAYNSLREQTYGSQRVAHASHFAVSCHAVNIEHPPLGITLSSLARATNNYNGMHPLHRSSNVKRKLFTVWRVCNTLPWSQQILSRSWLTSEHNNWNGISGKFKKNVKKMDLGTPPHDKDLRHTCDIQTTSLGILTVRYWRCPCHCMNK